MCPNLSAIDMTAKTFFERFYLVPGLGTFGLGVNCPCDPTPPPFSRQIFLDFREIVFPRMAPHFFDQHEFPVPGTRDSLFVLFV